MNLRHAAALALVVVGSGCFLPHREWSSRQAGVVLDKNTRRPIRGADVTMSGYWQAVTITDGDGKFEIPETPQFR